MFNHAMKVNMDVLLISNGDACRSRMAQEILYSFGRGLKLFTAGVAEESAVPQLVSQVMQDKGYEVSKKKPTHVSVYAKQPWDYVITLTSEAEEERRILPLAERPFSFCTFEDPFISPGLSDLELEENLRNLYDKMYKELYELYRDELSERLLPKCTCGANTFCRCE